MKRMSSILLSVGVLLTTISFSQETKRMVSYHNWEKTLLKEDFNVLVSNPTVYHGIYKHYASNTVIIENGNYHQGKKVGVWHYRNESDGLEYKTENYNQKGELHGEVIKKSGNSKGIIQYKNGNLHGYVKAWNEEGKLTKHFLYHEGKQHGKQLEYHYKTGILLVEGEFNMGEKIGVWQFYYDDGSLKEKNNYTGNQCEVIGYQSNGETYYTGLILNSQKEGEWKYYSEEGELEETQYFENGYRYKTLSVAEMQRLEEEYNTNFKQANQLFENQQYEEAKEYYQLALELKPNNSEVTVRYQETDNLIRDIKNKEIEAEYQSLITEADSYYQNNKYQNAINSYQSALDVKPNENYSQERINEIQNDETRINDLNGEINSKYSQFQKLYIGKKEVAFLADEYGKPIQKTNYSKGKYLYLKSESLIKDFSESFLQEVNQKEKISIGENMLAILNKLISLADTDTKDLNKQMKKTKTLAEVKNLLEM